MAQNGFNTLDSARWTKGLDALNRRGSECIIMAFRAGVYPSSADPSLEGSGVRPGQHRFPFKIFFHERVHFLAHLEQLLF